MNSSEKRGGRSPKRLFRPEQRERFLRYLRQNTWLVLFAVLVLVALILFICVITGGEPKQEETFLKPAERERKYETAYISTPNTKVVYYDSEWNEAGEAMRGSEVTYSREDTLEKDEQTYYLTYFSDLSCGYVAQDCLAQSAEEVVSEKTIYVRTPQNLRQSEDGLKLGALVEQGTELKVLGFDYLENGVVHLYKVQHGSEEGYISGEYTSASEEEANEIYDRFGVYTIHGSRGDVYGGGDGESLDYYPREKGHFETEMPNPCYSLYLTCDPVVIGDIDKYIEYAKSTKINTFVVNIIDGTNVGYPSEVYLEYSPTTYEYANNSFEEYQAAIRKIREAGFYCVGRLTTFNDSFFVMDHPEYAIADRSGDPLFIANSYWPSPYCRYVWEYKAALAKEAVESMGFNEIQFDYVRFPDGTYKYEKDGVIDYHNEYDETKAQAIQRFLMYATDELHDEQVYVGADVFGETSETYVTSYGQYWAAISNIVDVISGMPYPDHFAQDGKYRPWEHPYDTILGWAQKVAKRQEETPTPAVCRTWVQAYDAIREPYNTYGPDEVGGEIQALQDAGLTGGFMAWNASCSLKKMEELRPVYESLP